MAEESIEALARKRAARITREWYLHPDFIKYGLYDGVHLGECAEWVFYQRFVKALKHRLLSPETSRVKGIAQEKKWLALKWKKIFSLPQKPIGMDKKKCKDKPYALFSYLRRNLTLAKALYESGSFNLVIEKSEESDHEYLRASGIDYENFNNYLDDEIKEKYTKRTSRLLPLWQGAFDSPSFRAQFVLDGIDYFNEVKDILEDIFKEQFISAILCIEAIKKLASSRNLSLVILWIDYSPVHRAMSLCARNLGIPVLHVPHSVHGVDVMNEKICADRVAVFGEYSRRLYLDKGNNEENIVVTGNPEWDKFFCLNKMLDKDELSKKFGLDPERPAVMFATFWDAGALYVKDSSFLEEFYRSLLKDFKYLKEKHGVQPIIKIHPLDWERRPWYRKIAAEEGMEDIIIEWKYVEELLLLSDLVICRGSNIGFEALLLGKAVINYGTLFDEDKAVIVINDFRQIGEVIEDALFNEKVRRELSKRRVDAIREYNHADDGKATLRVMKVIEEMTGIEVKLPQDFVPYFYYEDTESEVDLHEDIDTLIEQGELTLARGDTAGALKCFEEILNRFPERKDALLKYGKTLTRCGRMVEAVKRLEEFLEYEPGSIEARLLIAIALNNTENIESAIGHLKEVETMPSSTDVEKALAFYYEGCFTKAINDMEGAGKCFERSLYYDPDSKQTLKEAAMLYFERGIVEQAVKLLKRILEKDPHDVEVLNDIGVICCSTGRKKEGKDYLKNAILIKPDYEEAALNLADQEIGDGNIDAAVSVLSEFLKISPDNVRIKEILASFNSGV